MLRFGAHAGRVELRCDDWLNVDDTMTIQCEKENQFFSSINSSRSRTCCGRSDDSAPISCVCCEYRTSFFFGALCNGWRAACLWRGRQFRARKVRW